MVVQHVQSSELLSDSESLVES